MLHGMEELNTKKALQDTWKFSLQAVTNHVLLKHKTKKEKKNPESLNNCKQRVSLNYVNTVTCCDVTTVPALSLIANYY